MAVAVLMTEKTQRGENAGPPRAFFFFLLLFHRGSQLWDWSCTHSGRVSFGNTLTDTFRKDRWREKKRDGNGRRKDGERKRRREKPRLTNCLGDVKSRLVDNGAYPS